MKHPEIVKKMSLEQKAAFVCGADYWHLKENEELGLPQIMVTDGPHGLRKKNPNGEKVGLVNSVPTTCFPPAATSSCSWDEDLLYKQGEALAEECLQEDVSVILGPGTNIKRSPTCGRNFEYFSEDPLLAGKCSASMINGVQSKGIGTSLKHFAVNSQEAYRMVLNEVVDERAFREVYLPAFEIAVKESQPWTIMNSYNKINGVYASQNEMLQEKICREEWGFEGLFVTDWGSSVDRITGLYNGTDLEMPSSGEYNSQKIIEAVKNGELDEDVLNKRVDNIVHLIMKSKEALAKKYTYDVDAHHSLAAKVAEGSMVLMKNEDKTLPLSTDKKVAVIGEMAKAPRYQGAGSSVINPIKLENAFDNIVAAGMIATYAGGYSKGSDTVDQSMIAQAVAIAKDADVAIVFAGLTEELEAEGYDRDNIRMPKSHNRLIEAVAEVNENTVVVLAGGSVVEMPWLDKVKAVLNSGLGGQAGGIAVANILTGKVNPSGKTSETYPLSYTDNPTFGNYPGGPVVSEHKESVYIGYRYYDTAKKDVLFPFGFGLSYTDFEYSDLKLSSANIKDTDELGVSLKVKNIGDVDGAEVVQLYVSDKESTIFRPEKELRAFTKVFLKAGEEKEISFVLGKRAFAFYNVDSCDWQVETGLFDILVGASSRDIRLSKSVNILSDCTAKIRDYRKDAPSYYGADVIAINNDQWAHLYGDEIPANERDKSKPIDLYCCLEDAQHTKWGGKICRLITKLTNKMGSEENGDGAMIAAMALQIPIRNFIAMSSGVMSEKMAMGLLEILNDDKSTAKGFGKIIGGIGGALLRAPGLIKSI